MESSQLRKISEENIALSTYGKQTKIQSDYHKVILRN